MMQDLGKSLLLSLANVLSDNRVKAASIEKALELICVELSFDCGLVYETNSSGDFCLTEHYASSPTTLPTCLDALKLVSQEHPFSAREGLFYITESAPNTPLERQLLSLFAAQTVVVTPILEGDNSLHGLVLLLRSVDGVSRDEPDRTALSAILSTLIRYMEIRMYQRKLHQTQVTLESIMDHTGIDIYVNDFYTHEILYVNQSMAAPYGGREAFMGQKCWQTLFPGQSGPCEFCPQTKLIDDQGLPTKVYTWDYQRAFDGSWFRVFSSAFQWVDGRLAHVVSSADITDNKRNEELVENLANYDQLTKLPNRRMMLKECDQRIDKATALEHGYVLFFDIDGFKAINDTLGHDAGDEFLVQLGEFFTSIPFLKDSIYRNGGDEFVAIIGSETITKTNILSLTCFIHERFKKPWMLKKGEISCSTSIGVACFPEDGVTAEVLLQKADKAMYQVKQSGGGGVCFGYQLAGKGDRKESGTPERVVIQK